MGLLSQLIIGSLAAQEVTTMIYPGLNGEGYLSSVTDRPNPRRNCRANSCILHHFFGFTRHLFLGLLVTR
jgi:hypothetical protein